MSTEPKFLIVTEGRLKRTIALGNIASAQAAGRCTRIVLKEVKDGKNVEFICNEGYNWVQAAIQRLANS
jgi:hypothetical protein